jgi:branched-chain amino acid transport system permease protein
MQWFVNGVADGMMIALLSFAFMLVYSSTRVFFVALAGVYTLAPYIAVALRLHGLPIALCCAAGVLASALIAALLEIANHWPLELRRASWAGHLVSSLGLNMVLVQSISLLWGNQLQVLGDQSATYGVRWAGITASHSQVTALIAATVLFIALALWSAFLRTGIIFRGLASDPGALALTGINVRFVRVGIFAASGALAACASLLRAYDVGFDAVSGLGAVVLGFVALVIGGKDMLWGGLVGGLLIGVMRAGVSWYLSARWQEPATFAVLALFLLLRPHGIIGKRQRLEAEA